MWRNEHPVLSTMMEEVGSAAPVPRGVVQAVVVVVWTPHCVGLGVHGQSDASLSPLPPEPFYCKRATRPFCPQEAPWAGYSRKSSANSRSTDHGQQTVITAGGVFFSPRNAHRDTLHTRTHAQFTPRTRTPSPPKPRRSLDGTGGSRGWGVGWVWSAVVYRGGGERRRSTGGEKNIEAAQF